MPAIGRLDQQITFQRATTVKNALNEQQQTWAPYFTCYARKRDWSDGEAVAAGQLGSFLRARFVVRSSPETTGLSPADRLAHEGELWSIHGIKETADGRNRFLEITAVKDNDAMGAYTPPPPDPIESEGEPSEGSEGVPSEGSEGVPMLSAQFYYPGEPAPGTVAVIDSDPYTMGSVFRIMHAGQIAKVRWYKPVDSLQASRSWGLWDETTGALLWSASNVPDSAAGGWVECAVEPPLPVALDAMITGGCTTNKYAAQPAYFSSDQTRGPIRVVAHGGKFKTGLALAKPDTHFNDATYWFDIVLEYEE